MKSRFIVWKLDTTSMKIQKSVLLPFLSILAGLPLHAGALKCGIKGITERCIGDTDPRYDPEVSYDLKSLSGFYENWGGLFRTQDYRYGADLLPVTSTPILGYELMGNFSQFPTTTFRNITISGSRVHVSVYEVMKNVDPSKPGMLNRLEAYYVSTFEKNGQAIWFGPGVPTASSTEFVPSADGNMLTPSSNETAELFGRATVEFFNFDAVIQASFLADGKQTSRMDTFYAIQPTPEGGSIRTTVQSTRSEGVSVADKNEWLQQMDASLADANVLSAATAPPGFPPQNMIPSIPVDTLQCANINQDVCPMEEDWQKVDPYYNDTPYVEPEGVLTGGFIAGVTIASIIAAILIFYAINRVLMQKQQERLKAAFSNAISKHIDGGLKSDLSPDEVAKLYRKVDSDGNGKISKEELKQLIDENELGSLSDRDFDVMFSTIDLDGNGEVNFTEFTAFFASLPTVDNDSPPENFNDNHDEA